ncbi:MAG: capsid protein [Cressdnaviricota sp.]|nr:MAG: capsid protein [Cressdnaviricota sp.]
MPKRSYSQITPYRRATRTRSSAPGGGKRGGSTALANAARRAIRLAPRLKRYRSMTMTMTKKKSNVRKMPDGITTVSSFTKGYRLKPHLLPLLKTAAPQYQVIRFGRRLNSAVNSYGTDHQNFFDTGFFQQMYTDLIPNPGSSNQRAFIENIRICVEFCNSGDQLMNIELYDIGCSKDTTQDPQTAMAAGFTTMNPSIASGNTANQTIALTTLGFTPFNSPQLQQYFTIDKVTMISLPPGHIHKHYISFSPRMILNETRRAAGANFFGGLSRHILYRTRGQPCTQVDNNTIVGVGPSSVDIVTIARMKVKYVAANRQVGWQFGGVDLGAVTTAEVMDTVQNVVDTFTAT